MDVAETSNCVSKKTRRSHQCISCNCISGKTSSCIRFLKLETSNV